MFITFDPFQQNYKVGAEWPLILLALALVVMFYLATSPANSYQKNPSLLDSISDVFAILMVISTFLNQMSKIRYILL